VGTALVLPQVLSAQGPAQGINVHGHWVIEVRNADGTLRLRREFENTLAEPGKRLLASLLAKENAFDYWQIQLGTDYLCNEAAGTPTFCSLEEPIGPHAFPYIFRNLTKTVTNSTLVLHGTFVAANNGSIGAVTTYTWIFSPSGANAFTSALLQSPIPIQATQTVSVTVTFTFS